MASPPFHPPTLVVASPPAMQRADSYTLGCSDTENLTSAYLLAGERDSGSDTADTPPFARYGLRNLFSKFAFSRTPSVPESNYLTLIPLSGTAMSAVTSRLRHEINSTSRAMYEFAGTHPPLAIRRLEAEAPKNEAPGHCIGTGSPRRRCASPFQPTLPCAQLLFTLAATCGVYFLVPRGISLGTVAIRSQEMSWNATSGTYNLVLQAEVPIYNPNYLQVGPPHHNPRHPPPPSSAVGLAAFVATCISGPGPRRGTRLALQSAGNTKQWS